MVQTKKIAGCAGLALALTFSEQANAQQPELQSESKATKWNGYLCDEEKVVLDKLKNLAKAMPTNETGSGKYFSKMSVYLNNETKAWLIMGVPRKGIEEGFPERLEKPMCIVSQGRNYPWELYDDIDFINNFKRVPLAPAPSDDDDYICWSQSEMDEQMKKRYGAIRMPFKSKAQSHNTYFSEFAIYANLQGDEKGKRAWQLVGVPKDPVTMEYSGPFDQKIWCEIDGERYGFPHHLIALKQFSLMFETNDLDWDKYGAKNPPPSYERETPTNLGEKPLDYGFK